MFFTTNTEVKNNKFEPFTHDEIYRVLHNWKSAVSHAVQKF